MGQHLQLYASKVVSLESARVWCRLKFDYYANPDKVESGIRSEVESEIGRLFRDKNDHLEHWSNFAGPACYPFLDCEAHICDEALIERAEKAAVEFGKQPYILQRYPDHDWANDSIIQFLKNHLGYVVWGYNDGV